MEPVLNRFDVPSGDIGETHGKAIIMEHSPVFAALAQMAKAACGKPKAVEKPHGMFHLFDLNALLKCSETHTNPQAGTAD